MKRFLTQLIIFSIPFLIIFSIPLYILWNSKENFYRIDNLLTSKEKYLIGYAYHENNYGYLKWTYLNLNEKKNIWALGSSRVLQFRENMFETPFYNVGYTISSINDFVPFLESLPNYKLPNYVILGLDQWMFNSSWDDLKIVPKKYTWLNSFTYFPKITTTYRLVFHDLFTGKLSSSLFKNTSCIRKIGLNAIINNKGFRNDGSMYYGDQILKLINNDSTANDYHYSNTFERIKHGNTRFEYCNEVNQKALLEVNELLKFCTNHNIIVIGFLPPFSDSVYSKMLTSSKYGYLNNIFKKIKPIFDSYKYEIYDFSNVAKCNSNDDETIDGFHGGEVTYQKMLISMLNSGSVLNRVCNVHKLEIDLKNRVNNYLVYAY